MSLPFEIKICGVKSERDVQAVARSQADAIGVNFHPASIRRIDPAVAIDLVRFATKLDLYSVGVFVDHSIADILAMAERVDLDMIQLHGDTALPIAMRLRRLSGLPVLRAIKLPTLAMNESTIDRLVMPWVDGGFKILVDADGGAAHGGTGKTLHWESLARWSSHRGVPFVLAGGITAANVADAIGQSGAGAVDAASGTEQPRGRKDAGRIDALASAAKLALGKVADNA